MTPIIVQMSAHQIAVARIYVQYILPMRQRSGWLILATIAAFSLALRYVIEGAESIVFGELFIGALILGGSWLLLVYTRERSQKSASRMYIEGFRLSARADGLEYRVGEAFEILAWDKFEKSLITKSWVFLYFSARWALIVPRTSFKNDDEYQAWFAFAQSQIEA